MKSLLSWGVFSILTIFLMGKGHALETDRNCLYYYFWLEEHNLSANNKFTIDLGGLNSSARKEAELDRGDAIASIPSSCREEWSSQGIINFDEELESPVNVETYSKAPMARTDRSLLRYDLNNESVRTNQGSTVSWLDRIQNADRILPLGRFPKLELYLRGSTANYQAMSLTSTRPDAILRSYRKMIPSISGCGALTENMTPEAIQNLNDCRLKKGKESYEKFKKIFDAANDQFLGLMANATGEELNSRDLVLMRHYHNMLNGGSEQSVLTYLNNVKAQLTTDEKLTLVQMWGGQFVDNYEDARNDAGGQARGVRTMDDLLGAARNNNYARYFGDDWTRGSTGSPEAMSAAQFSGVCRDIASAQGQMLRALGFNNTYVMSYAKLKGSYHVTTLAQDPDHPQVIYGLDYNGRRDRTGGSADALLQDDRDASMNYRIFIPGGRMVDNVQSELGKMLAEASGFTPLDPLARPAPQFTQAKMEVVKGLTLRAGTATDNNNASYYYGGASYKWNSGQVSITFASQERNATSFGMDANSTKNLDMIYAQIEQHFDSKYLQVSEHVRAKIESMAGIIFMGGRARDGSLSGKLSFQGDLYAQFGIRVDQSSASGRYNGIYRAGVQVSPGIMDVRNNYTVQTPVPVVNHFFLTAEGRYRLSQSAAGRAYLVAATMVLVDELGMRGRVQGGIQTGRVKILANMEGRLTNSTMNIQDGGERRAGIIAEWKPADFIVLALDASMAVGEDARYSRNPVQIMASVRVVF
ncbi:MAG: hypothetical protein A2X86_16215 [Bdellovibrionales bacterium GWA2_49_15]|nr:MAG: hypothetical protein A2X86_16215 [Bdellovibrionales bacterium GWA2_49_15]